LCPVLARSGVLLARQWLELHFFHGHHGILHRSLGALHHMEHITLRGRQYGITSTADEMKKDAIMLKETMWDQVIGNTSLTSLEIWGPWCNEHTTVILQSLVRHSLRLHKLSLGHCNIREEGTLALQQMLRTRRSLHVLTLHGCVFRVENCEKMIDQLLCARHLREVHMDRISFKPSKLHNNSDTTSLPVIRNSNITHLQLIVPCDNAHCESQRLEMAFFESLHQFAALEHLQLKGNFSINYELNEHVQQALHRLQRLPLLHTLILSEAHLNEDSTIVLAQSFERNHVVRHLDISNNQFSKPA
jgi:hypothetical protein